jgi:hypothetical protein
MTGRLPTPRPAVSRGTFSSAPLFGGAFLLVAEDDNALAASINPVSLQGLLVRHYKRREIVRELLGGAIVGKWPGQNGCLCASARFSAGLQ